ncbi:MAG: hypothetical protein GXY85_03770 [Candidatus Brocadiaceae bacterium]|nr:hypothetical protein [Candidatus Brocadiaceae bacterium]
MFTYMLRPVLGFIEWWSGLTPWFRLGVPVALLALSGILLAFGYVFVVGWGLGIVLLLFSGRSDAEKKGYHF